MYLRFLSRLAKQTIEVPNTDLVIRAPARHDMNQWISLRSESSDFLRIWEPKWPEDDLSPQGYMRRLRAYRRQAQAGTAKTFFILTRSRDQLLGGLSLTRLRRGVDGSATLGYWMGERHAGKGYMSTAVPAAVRYAFTEMKLARVDAACLPHNQRSRRLLEKCGFIEVCHLPKYLEINGVLEDHVLMRQHADSPGMELVKRAEIAGKSSLPMV